MPSVVNVVSASNADPIVVVTSAPHGLAGNAACTIAGVLGNLAANGTFQPKVLSATSFSFPPVAGTSPAPYVSGGTVTGPIGAMLAITRMISTELRQELVARGIPALLPAGEILFGPQEVYGSNGPGRVVFVPDTVAFEPGGYVAQGGAAAGGRAAILASQERRAQLSQRSRMGEAVHFQISVWGAAVQPDPDSPVRDYDYDAARDLYHALVTVMARTSVGTFKLTPGKWSSASAKSEANAVVLGREIVFGAEWKAPITDLALEFVPSGTTGSLKASIVVDGVTEQGFPQP